MAGTTQIAPADYAKSRLRTTYPGRGSSGVGVPPGVDTTGADYVIPDRWVLGDLGGAVGDHDLGLLTGATSTGTLRDTVLDS